MTPPIKSDQVYELSHGATEFLLQLTRIAYHECEAILPLVENDGTDGGTNDEQLTWEGLKWILSVLASDFNDSSCPWNDPPSFKVHDDDGFVFVVDDTDDGNNVVDDDDYDDDSYSDIDDGNDDDIVFDDIDNDNVFSDDDDDMFYDVDDVADDDDVLYHSYHLHKFLPTHPFSTD